MRIGSFILVFIILSGIFFQPALSNPVPAYRVPDNPFMMHISVASNGSFAIVSLTLLDYGKFVDGMCPIEGSPAMSLSCSRVSSREYLLLEVGRRVTYANLTPIVAPYNFTIVLPVPIGDEWFLEGMNQLPTACYFRTCPHVSYVFMGFSPAEARIGEPANSSGITARVSASIPELLSSSARIVNDSLIFHFSYTNKTYSVPLKEFSPYLKRLDFGDSSDMNRSEFLKFMKAVPLRSGLLIYLPTYGLIPYLPIWYELPEREYLLTVNYSTFEGSWVAHAGFISVPANESNVSLTQELFPPIFYYNGSKLIPLLNFTVKRYEWVSPDSGRKFIRAKIFLDLPEETGLHKNGSPVFPTIPIPSLKDGAYFHSIETMPHYSPTDSTFVDLCLNSNEFLHVQLENGSLTYLRMPFPGTFIYWNGSWVYNSLKGKECFGIYNGSYIYNSSKRTLLPLNTTIVKRMGIIGAYLSRVPGGISECVPDRRAAKQLKKVKVGEGEVFYYPSYIPLPSLKGAERIYVWGKYYGYGTVVPLNETCIFFYYNNGKVVSALKPRIMYIPLTIGNWKLEVALPYIEVNKSITVHVSRPRCNIKESKAKKMCGPALLLLLSLCPLVRKKKANLKFRKP